MLDLYYFLWFAFQFFIWNFGFWFVEFSLVGISTAVSSLLPQAILTHRITRHNRNAITNAAQILFRVTYKYCGNPHARCCNNTYPRWELCSEVRFEALKRQLGEYLKQQIGGFQPNLFFTRRWVHNENNVGKKTKQNPAKSLMLALIRWISYHHGTFVFLPAPTRSLFHMWYGPARGGKQKKVLAKTKRAHKDKKGKGRKRQKACKG